MARRMISGQSPLRLLRRQVPRYGIGLPIQLVSPSKFTRGRQASQLGADHSVAPALPRYLIRRNIAL